MPALQGRLVAAGVAVVAACAGLVATAPSAPASAPSEVHVPSSPGHVSTSWQGNAPFNNGNSGPVWGQVGVDDPTGACDPANPTLNSQHQVRVTFPKDLPKRFETLVRFSVKWTDDAGGNTTNDLAL